MTASDEILRARLAARGRETAEARAGRFSRAHSVAADVSPDATIHNDGALEDAVEAFAVLLRRLARAFGGVMRAARYAVYLAPEPTSALWRFGSRVIGRDAASGEAIFGYAPAGFDAASWRAATDEPRRYGFHATLKAPLRLREGCGAGRVRTRRRGAREFAPGVFARRARRLRSQLRRSRFCRADASGKDRRACRARSRRRQPPRLVSRSPQRSGTCAPKA